MRARAASFLAALLLVALVTAQVFGSDGMAAAEHRVSNGVLSLGICRRDAGAVCSIVYDGHELVNDHDHGRQLQVAWSYNDAGEAYNPTEAGSRDDGTKSASTSELLTLQVLEKTISTESHPAYWLRPGKGVNTRPVTGDTLKKKVTLGYQGDPHVIVVDTTVTVAPEATGPRVRRLRIETPAFYTSSALSEHYQLDRRSGAMTKAAPPAIPEVKDRMNARMGLNSDRQLVPVLASLEGRYAAALYTPRGEDFWTYSTYGIPSDTPAKACNKATVRFQHPAQAGASYSYRTFVVIGDLAAVIEAVKRLP